MSKRLVEFQNRVDRVQNDVIHEHDHSEVYLNYGPEHGEKNWKDYEEFSIGFTSLGIDWSAKKSIEIEDLEEAYQQTAPQLYQYYVQWFFGNLRSMRYFPARFFRQSDLVHGFMSMHSEKLKILTLVQYYFDHLQSVGNFDLFNVLNNEVYFFKKENRMQRLDSMLFYAIQQTYIEWEVIALLKEAIHNPKADTEELGKVKEHYEIQLKYLSSQIHKIWELDEKLKRSWTIDEMPRLYYMEQFVDFGKLAMAIDAFKQGELQAMKDRFYKACKDWGLGSRKPFKINPEQDFVLAVEDQKEYAQVMSDVLTQYGKNLSAVVDEYGMDNERILKEAYVELQKKRNYKDSFVTGVYEYYLHEQNKVQWHLQDVKKYVQDLGEVQVTDNDYDLIDIIKEIAYCEGFSYTIGYQNMYHVGQMHPFALWNFQQCHEELKHYHAIRALLQSIKVRTNDLDEQFLAQTFEYPDPDAYHDQYSVFLINFLGESHNIRAYRMLSDGFNNQQICHVLRLIAQDEVVHKKVFAAHFQYLCEKNPDWEKNAYECLLDHALGVHQAGKCDRYRVMMHKIGRYYAKTGKTDALKFLNMSMRAQYLELKSLFSPEIFKVSEYDFRRRHLKAYVF